VQFLKLQGHYLRDNKELKESVFMPFKLSFSDAISEDSE